MAINYGKKLIRIDQPVGDEITQHLVEGELVVSEEGPEIAKILDIKGSVYGTGKEVVQDKVMVEGILRTNLLYIPVGDYGVIAQAESETSFVEYIDLKGAKPKMEADIFYELEHLDYDVLASRKLNIKAVLNIGCKVKESIQLDVLGDFQDGAEIQALKESITLISTESVGSGQTILREDLELPDDMPSIVKVLRKEAQISLLDKRVAANRIIAHGEVDLRLLYQTEEAQNPIESVTYQIPFDHFVDVQGVYQGMDCEVDLKLQELDVSLRQDIIGDIRVVSVDIILYMEGKVLESHEEELITDAYSPGKALDLIKKKIILEKSLGKNHISSMIKESVEIPDNMPPAKRVLYMGLRPLITDYRMGEGQGVIDGVLTGSLIYQPEDDALPLNSIKLDIPFSQDLMMEGANGSMDCLWEARIERIDSALISPEDVEIKVAILVTGEPIEYMEKEILLDMEEVEEEEGIGSGIYVYFVQPGDNLWLVAKRYNTTIESIVRYNNIPAEGGLETGSKIMLFKKLDARI